MEKIKLIIGSYYDGILSEREALYRIVDLPAPNDRIKQALFAWLDGKVPGKATLKQVALLINDR